MATMLPTFQTFLDTKDGDIYGITKVVIQTTGSDNVVLPRCRDAALLNTTRGAADPTFYLSGNNNTSFNIDGDTVGTERVVVSRHGSMVNFRKET